MKWNYLPLLLLLACGQNPGTNPSELTEKFNAAWQSNDPDKVLKIRMELAEMAPRQPEGLYAKAWLADRSGDSRKAIKTADTLVMGFPQFDKGWYLRANLREKSGDLQGAAQDYDRALKRNPLFSEALINRGSLHFRTQHYDLALKDFEKAGNISPGNRLVFRNLGNVWMAFGKPEKACPCWRKADSLGMPGTDTLLKKYCLP